MRNYQEASELLGTRESKKVGNNTYLKRIDAGKIGLLYHQTYVVTYLENGDRVLTSGGWQTKTTKERLQDYGSDISQKAGIWYMFDGSLFYDGITLRGNMILKPRAPERVEKETKKLKARIKTFCGLFADKIEKSGLDLPNGGDCWHCLMKTDDGKTIGDLTSSDHLDQHIKDRYFVPSLAFNALIEAGYQWPQIILSIDETGKPSGYFMRENFTRSLNKYLYKRLNKATK